MIFDNYWWTKATIAVWTRAKAMLFGRKKSYRKKADSAWLKGYMLKRPFEPDVYMGPITDADKFLSIKEACAFLNVSRGKLADFRKMGYLREFKNGRSVRFRLADLQQVKAWHNGYTKHASPTA